MENVKCPFEHTLLSETFGCAQVQRVTQRDGPHAQCSNDRDAGRCQRLFNACKRVALPVFDVPDDLEKMPHSVPVKIQYGGLLGLATDIQGASTTIPDIHALVTAAEDRFGAIDRIPCADYVERMTAFQVKRRGQR